MARLDQELVARGLARSRTHAAKLIAAGRVARSGEPLGKAGAYAIQGGGEAFIQRLSGSYSGVMGLPLFETVALLRGFGIGVPVGVPRPDAPSPHPSPASGRGGVGAVREVRSGTTRQSEAGVASDD